MASATDIFRKEVNFVAGVANITHMPKLYLPEVAFIGRSNVGKSSLINAVVKRKKLARTSNSPGHTRQINFFSVAEQFMLVDLPGYGFAKVGGNIRATWESLIMHYLKNNDNLRLVNVLIDGRRSIKKDDVSVMSLLIEFGVDFQIVVTKMDKRDVSKNLEEDIKKLLESLSYSCNVIYTSIKNGKGAKELQLSIVRAIM